MSKKFSGDVNIERNGYIRPKEIISKNELIDTIKIVK
jgi:hypothetical protein